MGSLKFSLLSLCLFLLGVHSACSVDEDCSLNGVCQSASCVCDPGWIGSDCGVLDLSPVERWTGYNHTNATGPDYYTTGRGNSSWGGHIVQDPSDDRLFHLIIAQFAHGCGLDAWRPFSVIIRAESRTGPRGPYTWVQDLFEEFHHNPTTIWSPADKKYLIYFIGEDVTVPSTCIAESFTNVISVSSSTNLRQWTEPQQVVVQTNPAPWPLWSDANHTSAMLLGVESNNIYYAGNYTAIYNLAVKPNLKNNTEDPFLWRDKRGHWHFLNHDLIDHDETGARGPHVGSHAFARDWEGPWTFSQTIAYTTKVTFTDGTTLDYYRRERPKLYFSNDGNMTPLYLLNGVSERDNSAASYTLIQPIGTLWKAYEKGLGF